MGRTPEISITGHAFTVKHNGHYFSTFNSFILKLLTTLTYEKTPGSTKGRWVPDTQYLYKDRTQFKFPISLYSSLRSWFLDHQRIDIDKWVIERKGSTEGEMVNIVIREGWTLREYQDDVVKWGNSRPHPILVDLPTGKGKTVTSIFQAADYGRRCLFHMAPRLIDKWISDIEKTIDTDQTTIEVISSTHAFVGLMERRLAGESISDIIMVSTVIFRNYIKAYMLDQDFDSIYPILPEDFTEVMGIGFTLIDEFHEQFKANYIASLFLTSHHFIGLTATLIETQDKILEQVYHYTFPAPQRYGKVKPSQHVTVYPIAYNIHNVNDVKFKMPGKGFYNHIKFEQSVMKKPSLKKDYLDLIGYYMQKGWYDHRDGDDRALIYVSSIAMADLVTEYFQAKWPDLDIRRYVANDPYENVIDADLRISTPKKCGSAIDIPNLTTILMTPAINSAKSNIQIKGRGRELEDKDVRFIYFYCEQIKKHLDYHYEKIKIFRGNSAKIVGYRYPIMLGST